MRKIYGCAYSIGAVFALSFSFFATTSAQAQNTFINQNISGFNLPGVTLPQGHDEVRAADGTTCRSAVAGNGAYLDVGLIGNPEQSNNEGSLAAYTRVVVPLGAKRDRIDCGRLYDLEVRRLQIELKLMELGLNRGIAPVGETSVSASGTVDGAPDASNASDTAPTEVPVQTASVNDDASWDSEGWTTDGRKEN